jgi:hypothetical protein
LFLNYFRVGDYKLIKGMPGLMDGYAGNLHMAADNFMAGKRMNYNFDFAAIFKYAKDHSNEVRIRKT